MHRLLTFEGYSRTEAGEWVTVYGGSKNVWGKRGFPGRGPGSNQASGQAMTTLSAMPNELAETVARHSSTWRSSAASAARR
jgi:hypothetical protein